MHWKSMCWGSSPTEEEDGIVAVSWERAKPLRENLAEGEILPRKRKSAEWMSSSGLEYRMLCHKGQESTNSNFQYRLLYQENNWKPQIIGHIEGEITAITPVPTEDDKVGWRWREKKRRKMNNYGYKKVSRFHDHVEDVKEVVDWGVDTSPERPNTLGATETQNTHWKLSPTCLVCLSISHISDVCPHALCSICKARGCHLTQQCFNRLGSAAADCRKCLKCLTPGHTTEECRVMIAAPSNPREGEYAMRGQELSDLAICILCATSPCACVQREAVVSGLEALALEPPSFDVKLDPQLQRFQVLGEQFLSQWPNGRMGRKRKCKWKGMGMGMGNNKYPGNIKDPDIPSNPFIHFPFIDLDTNSPHNNTTNDLLLGNHPSTPIIIHSNQQINQINTYNNYYIIE